MPDITSSPEATVLNLYAALSCGPGDIIDRERVRALFAPGAPILFATRSPEGEADVRAFAIDSFLDAVLAAVETRGRDEHELWQRVDRFGDIAHVFSAYRLQYTSANGEIVTRRGVNSLQLHRGPDGWRIVSLIWDTERPGNPLPPTYAS